MDGRDQLQRQQAALGAALARGEAPPQFAARPAAGFALAALLVAKLRFQILMRGSARAAAAFDADPERFAVDFRRYCGEVAPRAFGPAAEARSYAEWCDGRRAGSTAPELPPA